MKKLIYILFLLTGTLAFSQQLSTKVDVVKYRTGTTTQRDLYVVPVGEKWHFENTTTNNYERWDGTNWVTVGAIPEASEVSVSPAVNGTVDVQSALEDHETRIDGLVAGGGADGLGPDGNVGDLTIGGSGTTATINDDAVTSAKILDGTITNTDVNASAAIAGTKIAITPFTDVSGTNVQTVLEEVKNESVRIYGTNAFTSTTWAIQEMAGTAGFVPGLAIFSNTNKTSIIGGDNGVGTLVTISAESNAANITGLSIAEIDSGGATSMVTKEWVEANGSGIQEHPDSGLTGIRIGAGTEAQKAAATLDAEDIWISTDATPAETITGTVIDMSGFTYIDDSAVDTATFTLTGAGAGGYAEILINEATEPTITGATQLPNTADFIAATNMLICLKSVGTTVYYFFVELP
jgi:hypothetical protein